MVVIRVVSGDTSTTCYVGVKAGLPPAPVSHTADDFQRFFIAKVEAVRVATVSGPTAVSTDVSTSQSTKSSHSTMTTWREVTPADVRRTILAAPVKSCSLDPVPTCVAWWLSGRALYLRFTGSIPGRSAFT